jgi:probable DNA metabolism protein
MRSVFQSAESIENNYSDPSVLQISQIAKQVHREKHRMEAFIRFERTKDDLYYATVEPDFNVLPLIAKHFKDRYADQYWMIYDSRRDYGIQYNKQTGEIHEVSLTSKNSRQQPFLPESIVHEEEIHYQQLWRQYFSSVNLGARKNTKLHIRHVPLRYWRFLTEKQ